jgi:hypothetical protein
MKPPERIFLNFNTADKLKEKVLQASKESEACFEI